MRCCLYHKPFSLSNFSQLSQDRWRNKANETYNFFLKRQTTRDIFKHKYNGAQLETAQNSRLQVASGHCGAETARIRDFMFFFWFSYLRICNIDLFNLYISFYSLKRKLKGAGGLRSQWSQNQQELEIVSLNSYLYLYFHIISLYLNHYLHPYYKENSRVQVGSGHSGAKNRKNWKFLLRSVVDMWQRSRTGNFLERVPSFLFVFYRTQVRLLLCVVPKTLHVVEFCSNWICQNWHMDFPELHGFVNIDTWISFSCNMDLSKLWICLGFVLPLALVMFLL